MKTVIVYSTKYGCSEKCAKLLAEKVDGAELKNVEKNGDLDIFKYDKVIIGGPIYMGMLDKRLDKFCKNNEEILKTKKLGIFVCSMFGGKTGEETMKKAFSDKLKNAVVAMEHFGGELNIAKMNFLDRAITKMVIKSAENSNTETHKGVILENIEKFANIMNNA